MIEIAHCYELAIFFGLMMAFWHTSLIAAFPACLFPQFPVPSDSGQRFFKIDFLLDAALYVDRSPDAGTGEFDLVMEMIK
ncbi:MAG: hypothetical protein V8T87_02850 [Victivallales bacterium]